MSKNNKEMILCENVSTLVESLPPVPAFPEQSPDKVLINLDLLKRLSHIGCSESVCAYVSGSTLEALQSAFKRQHNVALKDFIEHHRKHMEIGLRAKQYEKAMNGDTMMLKHLGKHILGQLDNPMPGILADKMKNISDNVLISVVNNHAGVVFKRNEDKVLNKDRTYIELKKQ